MSSFAAARARGPPAPVNCPTDRIERTKERRSMTEETTERYPLWMPPTYLEEGSFKDEYSFEDWRQAEAALGDLVQMAMHFDNEALLFALWDAGDRARIEEKRARQRAREAS
jgi:hypothetical protein